jgi:hypothetical protein
MMVWFLMACYLVLLGAAAPAAAGAQQAGRTCIAADKRGHIQALFGAGQAAHGM